MRGRDRGVIVQAGSALGHRGMPLQSAYCGAKHAVKGFTEALQTELKTTGSGVRVTRVDLPGVNTPQFDWVLNKMKEKPQPVAPIYAPELMATAMVHAAEHPRRRAWWIGLPTVYTVLGNKVWPQFMDWYLARSGESGQLTDEDRPADDPGNLWEPAGRPRRPGLRHRGAVQRPAVDRDPQIWASRHHGVLAAVGAAGLAGLAVLRRRR